MHLALSTLLPSGLLLAATTANLGRARGRWLRGYFWAHWACYVVMFAMEAEPTIMYEGVFAFFTIVILVLSAAYVLECSRIVVWQIRLAVLMFSISLPTMLYTFTVNGLSSQMHTVPSYLIISLGECCVIMALGLSLGIFAVTVRGASIPLALLWILLAAWEYAWTLGAPFYPQLLNRLNQFVPTALVVSCFVWAFLVQQRRHAR